MTSNPCCIVVAPASPNLGVCRVWFFCPSTVPPLQRFIYFVVWQLVRLTEDWDCRYTKLMSWLLVAEGSWEQVQYWFDWGGLVRDGARGLADQENSVLVRFKVLNMCLPTSRCCHVLPKPLLKDTMIHEFIPDFCFAFCVSLYKLCSLQLFSSSTAYHPLKVLALHTPGHTRGSICYFCSEPGKEKEVLLHLRLLPLLLLLPSLFIWISEDKLQLVIFSQMNKPSCCLKWIQTRSVWHSIWSKVLASCCGFSLHRWHSFCGRPDAESHISDLR